jgi:hypothetical protein
MARFLRAPRIMLARHADPKATQECPYPCQLLLDKQAALVSPLEFTLTKVLILKTLKVPLE